MRNRKPIIFLAAYFLAIFLWLLFCYKKVQKACVEAGHTAQEENGVLEMVWPDGEFSDRAERGYPFFGIFGESSENGGKYSDKNDGGNSEKSGKKDSAEDDMEKDAAEKKRTAEQEDGSGEFGGEEAAKETGETEDEASEKIRVVLTGAGGIYHEKILFESGGETLEITEKSSYFAKTDVIRIRAGGSDGGAVQVVSLDKSCGHPSYEGILEIRREEAGLVLINEVSIEDYVKGVLPSEMPSSYPLEALKAQAVCARTYAEMKQDNKVYPQYDAAVDDSTACQVYRNLETAEQGDLAVEETAGEVLRRDDGSFVECYYYSTSCGRGTNLSVWHGGETERPVPQKDQAETDLMNQEFFDYISQKQEGHLEAEDAFYRWDYRCEKADAGNIYKRCRDRQAVNDRLVWSESKKDGSGPEITEKDLGDIVDMSVVERKEGGVADCVRISCEKGCVYVWGEYNIRYVLAQGGAAVLQDGAAFQVGEILPSAFISLQSVCNKKGNMVGYIVVGGGFGHGVGMSQNGAKHMALAGNNYREILETYYRE